jgi:protein-S-isoprenylcysteine O-methyltransferase Ste14
MRDHGAVTRAASAVVKVPPPLFFVAAFLLGLLVERWVPSPTRAVLVEGGAVAQIMTVAAGVCFIGGFVLGPLNSVRFLVRGTTLNPTKEPTVFLTRGMYGFSRNPMYVGLFLIYVAIAVLKGTLWPLVTAVIPFLLLDRIVIPFEESRMAERYGASYRDYCSRVSRWISLGSSASRERP